MFSVIYNSFIQPLMFLMEAVLNIAYSITNSYGLSLLMLSVVVNILIIPFYSLADSWQQEEKNILKKISRKKDEIKAVFKGDEQYFYLKTLYRQNGYNPLMSIRSSFGLIIQIPFFIAAYRFLSHFQALELQSFLFLKDLSQADGLFGRINIMPFLMTLINLSSAFVFSKDMTKRERYQLYGMAGLFLVLLYNSPSGLLLYWTCNNFISLIKNVLKGVHLSELLNSFPIILEKIYNKIKLPKFALCGIVLYAFISVIFYYLFKSFATVLMVKIAYPPMLYLAVLSLLVYVIRFKSHFFSQLSVFYMIFLWSKAIPFLLANPFTGNPKKLLLNLFSICALAVFFPVVEKIDLYLLKRESISDKEQKKMFLSALTVLVLLSGLAIPSSLVASSPGEMAFTFQLLFQSFIWSFLWLFVVVSFFYYAAEDFLKKPIVLFVAVSVLITVFNFLFFPGNYGVISDSLQLEFGGVFDSKISIVMNLGINGVLGIFLIAVFLFRKSIWINRSLSILIVALLVLFVINSFRIINHESPQTDSSIKSETITPKIGFSKDQPNTVILFLDRSLAAAVPLALESLPELSEEYDGFTWYSNTLSFGTYTITGLPAMLGGYDYSPQGMINQGEKSLKEKVMEAWTVLPRHFLDLGHSVYIANPHSYDYKIENKNTVSLSDMDVTIDTLYDVYTEKWLDDHNLPSNYGQFLLRDKSIFIFSLFRMSPLFFRNALYEQGSWHSIVADPETYSQISNMPKARDLLKEWSALDYLPELSHTNATTPTFSFIGNNATHEVLGIDADFKPSVSRITYPEEDLKKYGSIDSTGHMYTNVAVLKLVTDWLNWMKDAGIYDNTQIIIAADHGRKGVYSPFFDNKSKNNENSPEYNGFHPLLMFKPFNTRGPLKTTNEFMTNGDVPSLVLEHFGNFSNPYTGNMINGEPKNGPLLIGDGPVEIYKHHKNEYLFFDKYYVSKSMLDPSNWSVAE